MEGSSALPRDAARAPPAAHGDSGLYARALGQVYALGHALYALHQACGRQGGARHTRLQYVFGASATRRITRLSHITKNRISRSCAPVPERVEQLALACPGTRASGHLGG